MIFHCKCHENAGLILFSHHFVSHVSRNSITYEKCTRSKITADRVQEIERPTTVLNIISDEYCILFTLGVYQNMIKCNVLSDCSQLCSNLLTD